MTWENREAWEHSDNCPIHCVHYFPVYSTKILHISLQAWRASVYQLYPGCLQKLKLLRERLLKKHTCPFQIILKYPILSLMFLALCPWFFSMAGRPSCSLKVKEKPKRMCPLSGLWIHFQMTLFFPVLFIKVTPAKMGPNPVRKDITFCLNMQKMSEVLSPALCSSG